MSFPQNEEHNMWLHQSSINEDILWCGRNFGNRLGGLESAIFIMSKCGLVKGELIQFKLLHQLDNSCQAT
jgi:hypothetical protein